jgi:hypothetical protein
MGPSMSTKLCLSPDQIDTVFRAATPLRPESSMAICKRWPTHCAPARRSATAPSIGRLRWRSERFLSRRSSNMRPAWANTGGEPVAYWTVAQLQPQRDRVALHCLGLAGFETYQRRLRECERERASALFPGYAFVAIELQWHAARWCPGVVRLACNRQRCPMP